MGLHRPLPGRVHALDLSTTLVAPVDTLYDRTPFTTWGGYGGLSFHGRGDWHDTRLLLADGVGHERVLGERSAWCALDGPLGDDEVPVGLAIFSSPESPRDPVPWYGSTRAATYGDEGWSNFLNAAFLWDDPIRVESGEPLHFSYRVVVHDGLWDRERIEAAYAGVALQAGGERVTAPTVPSLPGAIGVTHLRVYDSVAPDGLRGGTPHLHTACTEAYWVVPRRGRRADHRR